MTSTTTTTRNPERLTCMARAILLLSLCIDRASAFSTSTLRHDARLTSKQPWRSSNKASWRRLQGSNLPTDPLHDESAVDDPSRRQAWTILAAAVPTTLSLLSAPLPAPAALLQFPCPKLKNRYHFMRAGQSELEADDLYASNALFLTNRENALVDSNEARKPIIEACRLMRDAGQLPTVAYHSLAASKCLHHDCHPTCLQVYLRVLTRCL